MSGVSEEYMRDKLKSWNPNWNPDTIDAWRGTQLKQVYVKVQQEVVQEIMLKY